VLLHHAAVVRDLRSFARLERYDWEQAQVLLQENKADPLEYFLTVRSPKKGENCPILRPLLRSSKVFHFLNTKRPRLLSMTQHYYLTKIAGAICVSSPDRSTLVQTRMDYKQEDEEVDLDEDTDEDEDEDEDEDFYLRQPRQSPSSSTTLATCMSAIVKKAHKTSHRFYKACFDVLVNVGELPQDLACCVLEESVYGFEYD
jgi:hypothetical protein